MTDIYTEAQRKCDLAHYRALGQLEVIAKNATALCLHTAVGRLLHTRLHAVQDQLKAARAERDAVFAATSLPVNTDELVEPWPTVAPPFNPINQTNEE